VIVFDSYEKLLEAYKNTTGSEVDYIILRLPQEISQHGSRFAKLSLVLWDSPGFPDIKYPDLEKKTSNLIARKASCVGILLPNNRLTSLEELRVLEHSFLRSLSLFFRPSVLLPLLLSSLPPSLLLPPFFFSFFLFFFSSFLPSSLSYPSPPTFFHPPSVLSLFSFLSLFAERKVKMKHQQIEMGHLPKSLL